MIEARPFDALTDAVSACVCGDAAALANAFGRVPARDFFAAAVRHRCAGLLLAGIVQLRVRGSAVAEVLPLLQRYAAACALDSANMPAQISALVRSLKSAGIRHALLKTASRMYAGDSRSQWSQTHDIDVLISEADAAQTLDALLQAGYTQTAGKSVARAYRLHHHHLAPLAAPNGGKPVEVHVALAPQRAFSTRTAWDSLPDEFEEIGGAAGASLRLNAYGRCLHMLLHGAGLYRLSDAAQIAAELRADPSLLSGLETAAAAETIQPVPVKAVLAAAARIARLPANEEPATAAYVEWVRVREDLPAAFRGRMQLVDAWYANGGKLRGPATPLAVPRDVRAVRRTPCYRELAGRAIAAAAAYALVLRKSGGVRA